MQETRYYARFYFVPCYYSEEEHELTGRGPVSDCLLTAMIEFHHFMIFITSLVFEYEPSYPVKIGEKVEDSEGRLRD